MRVLVVCTGNICRSPVAERLLRQGLGALDAAGGITVASAGTHAVVDYPIQGEMVELLAGDGVSASGFSARQLTRELIADADLILVAAREHRRWLVRVLPSGLQRCYTLKEFARLAALIPIHEAPDGVAERMQWLAHRAPMARGRQDAPPAEDDIPDPYLRGLAAYRTAYHAVRVAVEDILECLGEWS